MGYHRSRDMVYMSSFKSWDTALEEEKIIFQISQKEPTTNTSPRGRGAFHD